MSMLTEGPSATLVRTPDGLSSADHSTLRDKAGPIRLVAIRAALASVMQAGLIRLHGSPSLPIGAGDLHQLQTFFGEAGLAVCCESHRVGRRLAIQTLTERRTEETGQGAGG